MTTYYIDFANGNDTTGDGSTGNPWKTLSKFLTSGANGDTCLVRGDDSEGAVYVQRNLSTSKTNLTIQNDVGHSPVFTAADITLSTAFSKTGGQTNVYEVANTGVTHGAWYGSARLTEVGDVATCDSTANSFFDDGGGAGPLYVNVGGAAPSDTVYRLNSAQRVLTASGAGLTWYGVNIQWFEQALDLQAAPTVRNASFRYCTWPFDTFYVMRLDGDGIAVSDCAFIDDGGQGSNGDVIQIEATAANIDIDSVVVGSTTPTTTKGWSADSIAVMGGTGHSIASCNFEAVRFTGNASGTIERCLFRNGNHHFITFDALHTGTMTAKYNTGLLTFDVTDAGVHGFVMHSSGTINLYHNVVAHLKRHTGAGGKEAYYISPTNGTLTLTMRNNVAYNCDDGVGIYGGVGQNLDLDYTGFFGVDNNYASVDPGDQGANDVTADPLFTDPDNDDFTLQPGSPYIDAGVAVAGVNDDYNGAAPDIGRFETEAAGAAAGIMMGVL